MANNKKARGAKRVWRGLTTVTASVATLALAGTSVIGSFRTDIDKFLGTNSIRVVTDEGDANV